MNGVGDVRIWLWTALVVALGSFGRHTHQIPLAISNKFLEISMSFLGDQVKAKTVVGPRTKFKFAELEKEIE